MLPAPAVGAVCTDILWCLGLGLLLGAARDLLGLLLGNGPVRCFVWDITAFSAAAVLLCGYAAARSASGASRWYMALGIAAGAAAWQGAVSGALHALARRTAAACTWPFRFLYTVCLRPAGQKTAAWVKSKIALHQKARKKDKKVAQNGKKQLQNRPTVLYN